MQNIYVFSGPCGCGKSTLADAFADHLIKTEQNLQVYVIHGDNFHQGLVETQKRVGPACTGFLYWDSVLSLNWECILNVAGSALNRGLDVIIDYVVEDELPMLIQLAEKHRAKLFYVVLTAPSDELVQRLTQRGSGHLIERSLFLKEKLDNSIPHRDYLFENGSLSVEESVRRLNMGDYEVACDD